MQKSDPEQYQRFMDMERQLQTQLLNSRSIPAGTLMINVVVHVVYYNGAQNISDAQINAQIQVLNDDFRRLNADRINTPAYFTGVAADAEIQFQLAKIDPNGNSTTGITRTQTSVNGFTQSLNNVKFTNSGGRDGWNPERYLNIWVCNLLSNNPSYILMGYSTFPVNLPTSPQLDGVVINYNYFGVGGHTIFPYNQGRTVTHEVGHWLNLYHIFGTDGDCSSTDEVADTPNQYEQTQGCYSGIKLDACTSSGNGIMYMNYMDYSNDACMNMFTNGQKARIRALFDDQNGLRRQLLTPIIVGSSTVCTSSTIYTIDDPLTNATVVWTYDTNLLNLSPGPGTNKATVSAKSGVSGNTWIRATINGSTILNKTLIANFPTAGQVVYIPLTINQVYNVYPSLNVPNLTGWDWSWMPGASYPGASLTPYNDHATVSFTTAGGYSLFAKVKNNCGTSPSPQFIYTFTVTRSSPGGNSYVYPNPASDILNIDMDAFIAAQSQSGQLQQKVTMYDIRLYDVNGNIHIQASAKSGIVTLTVSNLPDGIYYLHIYDGVSANPETTPIIVKH